jgi:hypothetical protein
MKPHRFSGKRDCAFPVLAPVSAHSAAPRENRWLTPRKTKLTKERDKSGLRHALLVEEPCFLLRSLGPPLCGERLRAWETGGLGNADRWEKG